MYISHVYLLLDYQHNIMLGSEVYSQTKIENFSATRLTDFKQNPW